MSLTVKSTGIHFHAGSEPNFAITTEEHPQGAWVIAADQSKQQEYYQIAFDAHFHTGIAGIGSVPVRIVCDRYQDSGEDRRFYLDVTDIRPTAIGFRINNLIKSLPPLSVVVGK